MSIENPMVSNVDEELIRLEKESNSKKIYRCEVSYVETYIDIIHATSEEEAEKFLIALNPDIDITEVDIERIDDGE